MLLFDARTRPAPRGLACFSLCQSSRFGAEGTCKVRVLQVTYSYKPLVGGADIYVDDLRRVLAADGVEVAVLQKPPAPDDPAVLTYPRLFSCVNAFWLQPFALPFLRRELRRHDVLVCHYPNYCLAALVHPRVIGLSHGVFWDDRPGALRSRVKRAWARWAFRRCARYVANDTFFLREVGLRIEPGATPFSEVAPGRWYVPNAVDTRRFTPGAPGLEASRLRPFLLVPRNLYWNRGVHLAIEAFALMPDRPRDLTLVVVGAEGQPKAVEAARRAVEAHGLSNAVVFAGGRARDELVGWYRAAELTIIPSLSGEGTSLAALESMACGTPVVSTDVGGLPDLPCVHAPPQAPALAKAMAATLEDREAERDRQRTAVCEVYNLERWAETWRHIVEDW